MDDILPPEEAERRMNEALTRALNTPPQPKPTPGPRKGKPTVDEAKAS
jgi:hypothetical protein